MLLLHKNIGVVFIYLKIQKNTCLEKWFSHDLKESEFFCIYIYDSEKNLAILKKFSPFFFFMVLVQIHKLYDPDRPCADGARKDMHKGQFLDPIFFIKIMHFSGFEEKIPPPDFFSAKLTFIFWP